MPLSSPVHCFAAQAAVWCHWIPGKLRPYVTRMSTWNGRFMCLPSVSALLSSHPQMTDRTVYKTWQRWMWCGCMGSSCVHYQSLLLSHCIPRGQTKLSQNTQSKQSWCSGGWVQSSQSVSSLSLYPETVWSKCHKTHKQLRRHHDGCMLSWCVHKQSLSPQ